MSSFYNMRNQNGRDTASNWEKNDPVLLSGDDGVLYNVLNSKQDTLVFDSAPMLEMKF